MTIDVKALAEASRMNAERLAACRGHVFDILVEPIHPTRQSYACLHCGGMVSAMAKRWYEIGFSHGRGT